MVDSRLSSRTLAFNLIAQCLFCFPSAFGGPCRTRTCDLYPFRLSGGIHPAPWPIYTAFSTVCSGFGQAFRGPVAPAPVRQHQSRQSRKVTWDAAFPLVPHERCDLSAFRLARPAAYILGAEVGGHQLPRGSREKKEGMGWEVWTDLHASHFGTTFVLCSPVRVRNCNFYAIRLKIILSFLFIPTQFIQTNMIMFCNHL